MTVSRVRPYIALTLAVGALTAFLAVEQAVAQSGPVRLTPPQNLAPPQPLRPPGQSANPDTEAAPAGVPARPSLPSSAPLDAPIQVNRLDTLNPDTAGILTIEEGGFGVDMWAGTSARMLQTMMDRLPVNIHSPVMRELMSRLLLSTAALPKGMPGDGRYVARRVALLSAMGDTQHVGQLLDAVPGRSQIGPLMRYEADARFLANDNARACSLAARQIDRQDNAYWQKAFIFCQALAGEHDKAALGLSLLREYGDQDEAFYALVVTLSGNRVPLESLQNPTPLLLSMARVSNSQLPSDVVSSSSPGILRTIATSPNASIEVRMEAAERAEMAGALDVDNLRQLYTSVTFSDEELANPLSKAEAERGPMSRALLYRASLIQNLPIAKAEAAAKALQLAKEGGRYTSTVRVFMPILKRIPPSSELIWFAPEIIRAFLIGGEQAFAGPWFNLMQSSALQSPETAAAMSTILPIARLAGSSETHEWNATDLINWWAQIKGKENAHEKATLLFTLFDVLGEPIPQEIWEVLLDGPERTTMLMPNASIWRSLKEATHAAETMRQASFSTPSEQGQEQAEAPVGEVSLQGLPNAQGNVVSVPLMVAPLAPLERQLPNARVGEIIMLSLVALGESGPGQADPIVLDQVLRSLNVIGLKNEVRQLVLEAAVVAGL